MCVGKAEIRDIALGLEMAGLQGWTYPYQRVVIDDRIGEVVGFWKQVATDPDDRGASFEIHGIGGSWFRLAENAGRALIEWQRDFFDFGHVQTLYLQLMRQGKLSRECRNASSAALPGEAPGLLPDRAGTRTHLVT